MAVLKGKEGAGVGGGGGGKCSIDPGKYARYTTEQVKILERAYLECPNPSSLRRLQFLKECPLLSNIEPRQLKVWFQNRRCRDKQRKESSRLVNLNEKLSAMNKVLVEENNHLSKQAIQLVSRNQQLRDRLQQLKNRRDHAGDSPNKLQEPITGTTTEVSSESVITSGLHPPSTTLPPSAQEAGPARLMSIAEETLAEFLAKATGTALNWIQMPGMKPGPDSIGIVSVSHGCNGIAARACGLVGLDPAKIAEVLKYRPAWLRDCRRMDVLGAFNTSSGGLVELLYTQMYSLTTLALPRDFCTLRYTSVLEDRNVVVCERSLPVAIDEMPVAEVQNFVRAEMFSSGFLIRPYGSVGSIVHIVDHWDLKPESVPEVLRPLFESSSVLAHRTTLGAMRYLRSIVQEEEMDSVVSRGLQPSVIRTLSQRMSRGFNDAINSLSDDGWSPIANDGMDDVSIAVNTSTSFQLLGQQLSLSDKFWSLGDGIICAKTSLLLQNVPPALLVRFLREHRSEWADFDIGNESIASLGSTLYGTLGFGRGNAYYGASPLLLAHSAEQEELLELLRMETPNLLRDSPSLPKDHFLLQLCNGLDESTEGASAQLVFAPVNVAVSEDMPLLPSGFRVVPLDSNLMDGSRTLDLASTLEGGSTSMTNANDESRNQSCPSRSILTIAFQFPFDVHACDRITVLARKYVRAVVASVLHIAMALSPNMNPITVGSRDLRGPPELVILVHKLLQSYRTFFGVELLRGHTEAIDASFKLVWHHPDAILCCVWKSSPEIIFANQSGLDMLETTTTGLQSISWEKTIDEQGRTSAYEEFSQVMQRGFAHFPCGVRISRRGRASSYERALAWKVDCDTMPCVAFMFTNWSFQA